LFLESGTVLLEVFLDFFDLGVGEEAGWAGTPVKVSEPGHTLFTNNLPLKTDQAKSSVGLLSKKDPHKT